MSQNNSANNSQLIPPLSERVADDPRVVALAEAMPQMVWTATPDGVRNYYNKRWLAYTGLTPEQMHASDWENVLHHADLQACNDAWTDSLATGSPHDIEIRLKRASDGAYRWHLCRAVPLHDGDGNIDRWVGTCTDMHDQKEAVAAFEDKVRQRTADLAAANLGLLHEVEERRRLADTHERDAIRLNEIITTQCQLAAAKLDLEAFMKLVVYRMDMLTQASGSVVEMVDGDEMVFRAASGVAIEHLGLRLSQANSISGLCVETGQLLRCDDTDSDDRVDRLACVRIGVRSLVVAPLFHEGRVIGVLKSMAGTPYAFGARDMQTLQLMSGLIGSAIAHQVEFNAKQSLLNELSVAVAAMQAHERRTEVIVESSHDAFVGIDEANRITDWNGAAERTFGWTRSEAIGRSLAETILPIAYQEANQSGLHHFLTTGEGAVMNRRFEVTAVSRDGAEFPVEMTINEFEVNGHRYFGAFLHDISERQKIAQELEQKQQLLDAVLETIDVGVIACSSAGELTLFNRVAREFHGLPVQNTAPDQWANQYDLFQGDGKTRLAKPDIPLFRALQGEIVRDAEMAIKSPQSSPRFLLASGRPLIGKDGKNLGAVVAMQDVSERKEVQNRLAVSEQRIRAITDNLPMLIGQIDKDENFLFLNKRAERYYGVDTGALLGKSMRSAYDDAEYQRIKPYFDAAMSGYRASFEGETTANGKPYHYHAAYLPDRGPSGAVEGVFAMAYDITTRKNSELRQADSEERLRTITDSLPVLISYIDSDERYQFGNATYQHWLGSRATDMCGKTVQEVLGEQLYEPRKELLRRALKGEYLRFEMDVDTNGILRTVESIYVPHFRNGTVDGIYTVTTDITALKNVEKQLSLLARSDALTNLPNRRSFDEQLSEAAMRAKRSEQLIALMYLDIDRFKVINDSLGHAGGDEVLKEFATRLAASVRSTDAVARLAGDEFTVILEGIRSQEEALLVAEKILAAVQMPFSVSGKLLDVTTSIGIAFLTPDQGDLPGLISRSDAALYRAKSTGRNRVCV